MKGFVRVMKALSDPHRITILKLLQRRKLCVREIQRALQIPQPSVSKHLKVLGNAGLVSSQKDGLWVNYRISEGSNSPYAATVLCSLRNWLEDDAQLIEIFRKLPFIQRENISGGKK
jgi:ArsR family transcriptional regulator